MPSSDKSSKGMLPNKIGFWTTGRIVLSLAVLGLLGAFGFSSCNSSDQSTTPSSKTGTAAPPSRSNPATAVLSLPHQIRDAQLHTLDGEALKLSDYANNVLVVNIWATWCGPCQQEMPDLVKLSKEYKSQGLVVLGLATTYNEHNDIEFVKDFVKAKKVDYKIIWDDGSLAQPLVQMVNGRNIIPQSFVISRDGRIVKHFPGFSATQTPALMRQAVEEALSAKS